MKITELEKIECKLKKIIKKEMLSESYDSALNTISLCASILYLSNIKYFDEFLELSLSKISKKVCPTQKKYIASDVILYYDGLGFDERGLSLIYTKALSERKKLVYVTYNEYTDRIPKIKEILSENNCKIYYIDRKGLNKTKQILSLKKIVDKTTPSTFILYAYPDDVIATTLLFAYENLFQRIQINLTDHAFWLGSMCIDKCIEFREYGANISFEYRHIESNKIFLVPYYPKINSKIKFEGFPFENWNHLKVIFSGGSVYKTHSQDNAYYDIVRYILDNHNDSVFLYAGNGESKKMSKLVKDYPSRVAWISERKDFYQIIEKSFFYLNTYPVIGGMMTQYAAMAGKIPLTLMNSSSRNILENQEKLGINFYAISDAEKEIDKLFIDSAYKLNKEHLLKKSVPDENEFKLKLYSVLENRSKPFSSFKHEDVDSFRKEYINNFSYDDFAFEITKKNIFTYNLLYAFGNYFFKGYIKRIIKLIKK